MSELIKTKTDKGIELRLPGQSKRFLGVVIDPIHKRIMDSYGNWYEYHNASEIHLKRRYETRGFESKNSFYVRIWTIELHNDQYPIMLLELTYQYSNSEELSNSYRGAYLSIGQEIASITGLAYVDNTGNQPFRRNPDESGISLRQILERDKYPKYNGQIPEFVLAEFNVDYEDGKVTIEDKDFNLNQNYVLLIGIILFFDLIFTLITFNTVNETPKQAFQDLGPFPYIMIIPTLLVIPLSNRLRYHNIIEIDRNSIRYNQFGLYKPIQIAELGLNEVQAVIQAQTVSEWGLELVSSKKRIPITGKLDSKELHYLEQLLWQMIVSV